MASSNFIEVESPKHFQDFLSQDLNRVSVINFWAQWAEPCKQMNQVAEELSGKYKAALFLQVSGLVY
jgi:thiol-disulfide isomerase/thioredoxin